MADAGPSLIKSRSARDLRYPSEDKMEPIAIIGFDARLPGNATSTQRFWQMLIEGGSTRTEVPRDRFNIDAFYHPDNERIDTVSIKLAIFERLTYEILVSYAD